MSREAHVRFWESAGVRFPRATRLPLNRIQGILQRIGIDLPKQTQWDMLVQFDSLAAQAIVSQMRKEIRNSPGLFSDDTPVTFCFTGLSGQRLTKKGHLFVWHSPCRDGPPKVMAEFRLGRDANGPLEFLKGRSPVLFCNGYSGYDPAIRQNEIRRAGCWAHARRYFVEAFKPATSRLLGYWSIYSGFSGSSGPSTEGARHVT
jgi:transposase